MTVRPVPSRTLPAQPDLAHLRRQAKDLLKAFAAGDAVALAEVHARYRDADPHTFALHDAQLVLARSYGFDSWPKLKARVDGVTTARLCEAVAQGDQTAVRAMLHLRPEIVNFERLGHGEQRALHVAVLRRDAAMVRVLMEHGADAGIGIWPNRDATSPMTIAAERGYDEIVAIMRESERRAAARPSTPAADAPADTGALTLAVMYDRLDDLTRLLESGADPDERIRVDGIDEVVHSWGMPLYHAVRLGKPAMAEMLLRHGADPNAQVHASGSPIYMAYRAGDPAMIALLSRHGGVLDAASVGYLRLPDLARQMLNGEVDPRLDVGRFSGETVEEQLLWSGASGGDEAIVRMSLERLDWPRTDARWFWMLWRPLPGHWVRSDDERTRHLACFRLILERCDPNLRAQPFGQTMLHEVTARDHGEGVGLATALLDAGARTDIRDDLLASTPLGWACRWGRIEIVDLLLARGADPVERDAEPWATPRAWASRMGHAEALARLRT